MMRRMFTTMMNHMQRSRGMEMPLLGMDFFNMGQASDLCRTYVNCCIKDNG